MFCSEFFNIKNYENCFLYVILKSVIYIFKAIIMKFKFYFSLVVFYFLISSNLYAFSNKYFEVSNTGFTVDNNTTDESEVKFIYKNSNTKNYLLVKIVKKESEKAISKFDQKELDSFRDAIKDGAFKDYLNGLEKAFKQQRYLIENTPCSNKKEKKLKKKALSEIQKKIDSLPSESKIDTVYYTNVNEYKAYAVNFNISKINFKRMLIPTKNYLYIIEAMYNGDNDITSTKEYEEFIKSFKAKDEQQSNFYLYVIGRYALALLASFWKYILAMLVMLIFSLFKYVASKK